MGISVDDVYRIEHNFISKVFEYEDDSSLHTVKALEMIRGTHIMASGIIAEINRQQSKE